MTSAFGNISKNPGMLQGKRVNHIPSRLPQAKRGMRRRITVITEPVLHEPCADVTNFGSPELKTLIEDMFTTMEIAHGVGLAANQVGVAQRVFVFDCEDAHDVRHVGHICNPVIDEVIKDESDLDHDTEGCLSVPGPHAEVARPWAARVSGVDWEGNPISFEGEGLFARCLQHETDHLNGLLYVDHLGTTAREQALNEMQRMRDGVWAEWDARAERLGKTTLRDAE